MNSVISVIMYILFIGFFTAIPVYLYYGIKTLIIYKEENYLEERNNNEKE